MFSAEQFLKADKIGMDITWIKADSNDNDMTLAELLNNISEKADKITSAVNKLKALLKGIEE